jgi:hypothetical protein
MKWIKEPKTLQDGFYWWRPNEFYPQEDYEMIKICNGFIIDSRPTDSYGANWEIFEHTDFLGEWNGPLVPPK